MGRSCSKLQSDTSGHSSSPVRQIRVMELDEREGGIQKSSSNLTSSTSFFQSADIGTSFIKELNFRPEMLTPQAIRMMKKIYTASNQEVSRRFKTTLSEGRKNVGVKESSLNQVAYLLHLQHTLPPNYLAPGILPPNFEEKIQDVAYRHAKSLPGLARQREQFHHALPHGVKLADDVMRELQARGIWQEDTDEHRLLRSVTYCIAMLHDYIQKNEASLYESNEEATAEKVYEWLALSLELPFQRRDSLAEWNLKCLLKLVVYELIVGGSTPLMGNFSAVRLGKEEVPSMDLIDLQEQIEGVLAEIGEVLFDSDNAHLIHEMKQVAKLLGKNDKTPGAASLHAMEGARARARAIEGGLQKGYATTPVLDDFFEAYFVPYFSEEQVGAYYTEEDARLFGSGREFWLAVNRQNFFTSFTPHLLMPPEFLSEKSEEKSRLQDFIAHCRDEYLKISGPGALLAMFNEAFHKYRVASILETVFFSPGAVAFERKFVGSQRAPLEKRIHELRQERLNEAKIQLLVDVSVIQADKKNLAQLKLFYDMCVSRDDVIKELMFAAVFSEGQLRAYQLDLHEPQASLSEELNERPQGRYW